MPYFRLDEQYTPEGLKYSSWTVTPPVIPQGECFFCAEPSGHYDLCIECQQDHGEGICDARDWALESVAKEIESEK